MSYKPLVVSGRVTGTGWPIDGHVLYFSQWAYDNYGSWHLYSWDDADDEAVMLTMYQTEKEAGFLTFDTLEAFTEAWKAKQWEAPGAFCIGLDQLTEVKILREEEKEKPEGKRAQRRR